MRKSGLDIIGDIPWGMHMSLFYETTEDLIGVLTPYFKAGLENNEFCVWIISEPLTEEAAKVAMKEAMPDFDQYLKEGRIEIIPHAKWYLKEGLFSPIQSIVAWIEKLQWALSKKYDGIRAAGDALWLNKEDWSRFISYECEINKAIRRYKIIAFCAYPVNKCNALQIINVGVNHRFAIIKENHRWKVVKNRAYRHMKERMSRKKGPGFQS